MADDRLDWFPCNPVKLLGALAGMKAHEGYVYTVVLLRIYEIGGPCPDTLEALATRTRLNKRIVSDCLNTLFQAGRLVRKESGIHNPVAEEVLASSKALRERRQRAGSDGGKKSAKIRQKNQRNDPSKATDLLQQTSTPLQLQLEDSLSPNGDRADEPPSKEPKIVAAKPLTKAQIERKELFDRGKEILGDSAGGMIQQLLAVKHGNVALARAAIEQASTMDNARQYIGAITKGGPNGRPATGNGYAAIAARVRHGNREKDASADLEPGDGHRHP